MNFGIFVSNGGIVMDLTKLTHCLGCHKSLDLCVDKHFHVISRIPKKDIEEEWIFCSIDCLEALIKWAKSITA